MNEEGFLADLRFDKKLDALVGNSPARDAFMFYLKEPGIAIESKGPSIGAIDTTIEEILPSFSVFVYNPHNFFHWFLKFEFLRNNNLLFDKMKQIGAEKLYNKYKKHTKSENKQEKIIPLFKKIYKKFLKFDTKIAGKFTLCCASTCVLFNETRSGVDKTTEELTRKEKGARMKRSDVLPDINNKFHVIHSMIMFSISSDRTSIKIEDINIRIRDYDNNIHDFYDKPYGMYEMYRDIDIKNRVEVGYRPTPPNDYYFKYHSVAYNISFSIMMIFFYKFIKQELKLNGVIVNHNRMSLNGSIENVYIDNNHPFAFLFYDAFSSLLDPLNKIIKRLGKMVKTPIETAPGYMRLNYENDESLQIISDLSRINSLCPALISELTETSFNDNNVIKSGIIFDYNASELGKLGLAQSTNSSKTTNYEPWVIYNKNIDFENKLDKLMAFINMLGSVNSNPLLIGSEKYNNYLIYLQDLIISKLKTNYNDTMKPYYLITYNILAVSVSDPINTIDNNIDKKLIMPVFSTFIEAQMREQIESELELSWKRDGKKCSSQFELQFNPNHEQLKKFYVDAEKDSANSIFQSGARKFLYFSDIDLIENYTFAIFDKLLEKNIGIVIFKLKQAIKGDLIAEDDSDDEYLDPLGNRVRNYNDKYKTKYYIESGKLPKIMLNAPFYVYIDNVFIFSEYSISELEKKTDDKYKIDFTKKNNPGSVSLATFSMFVVTKLAMNMEKSINIRGIGFIGINPITMFIGEEKLGYIRVTENDEINISDEIANISTSIIELIELGVFGDEYLKKYSQLQSMINPFKQSTSTDLNFNAQKEKNHSMYYEKLALLFNKMSNEIQNEKLIISSEFDKDDVYKQLERYFYFRHKIRTVKRDQYYFGDYYVVSNPKFIYIDFGDKVQRIQCNEKIEPINTELTKNCGFVYQHLKLMKRQLNDVTSNSSVQDKDEEISQNRKKHRTDNEFY